ncbi:MAG: hypothetical protein M3131_04710 [Actinomycetota bacterium]|nr:hypothetical protein [Actinomycetota bacterium]
MRATRTWRRSGRWLPATIGVSALLVVAASAVAAAPYKGRFYAGTSSQAGKVRLKVSPGGKWVGRVDFGKARIQCDTSEPGELTEMRLAYPGVLRVGRGGRFAGTLPNEYTNEGAIVIRGRFVRRGTATGTVRYLDRGCVGTNTVTWTAKVVTAGR